MHAVSRKSSDVESFTTQSGRYVTIDAGGETTFYDGYSITKGTGRWTDTNGQSHTGNVETHRDSDGNVAYIKGTSGSDTNATETNVTSFREGTESSGVLNAIRSRNSEMVRDWAGAEVNYQQSYSDLQSAQERVNNMPGNINEKEQAGLYSAFTRAQDNFNSAENMVHAKRQVLGYALDKDFAPMGSFETQYRSSLDNTYFYGANASIYGDAHGGVDFFGTGGSVGVRGDLNAGVRVNHSGADTSSVSHNERLEQIGGMMLGIAGSNNNAEKIESATYDMFNKHYDTEATKDVHNTSIGKVYNALDKAPASVANWISENAPHNYTVRIGMDGTSTVTERDFLGKEIPKQEDVINDMITLYKKAQKEGGDVKNWADSELKPILGGKKND